MAHPGYILFSFAQSVDVHKLGSFLEKILVKKIANSGT